MCKILLSISSLFIMNVFFFFLTTQHNTTFKGVRDSNVESINTILVI
jgi:hypothetical protein